MPIRPIARALPAERLTWRCDPSLFNTPDAAEHPTPIGQPRALEALEVGLSILSPGNNIFVCGPSGTGKMSTVRSLLGNGVSARRELRDYAYVNNFDDPDRPWLLTFPAGLARKFRKRVDAFVDRLADRVAAILDSEPVERERRAHVEAFDTFETELLAELEQRARAARFQMIQVEIGEMQRIELQPIFRRRPVPLDELTEMVRAGTARVPKLAEIVARHQELKEGLRQALVILRRRSREMQDAVEGGESRAVLEGLAEPLAEIAEEFPMERVAQWLQRLGRWIADHLERFRDNEDADDDRRTPDSAVRALRVRVVLDNDGQTTPPVVFENYPTYTNLFGTVERPTDDTRATVDFNDIKGGSLLRADGGYLVINADDAVAESGVWRGLTRVLKTRELEIQSPEQVFAPGGASALKPDPIPVDVKVIAVGDEDLYRALFVGSEDFRRVFKIKADFDDVLPLNAETLAVYQRHFHRVAAEEGLPGVSVGALARLAEFGVRLAGRQEWLSARFSDLTDVLREAAHVAHRSGHLDVEVADVEASLNARERRHALAEDRMRDVIRFGLLRLETSGERVGAANALTFVDIADHAFGQPCRVTATCAPGHDGVRSVEREVQLSGRLHDKGTLIITAYLRARYLPERPMALAATVAFEQLHEEVDGDSASLAEALALMSTLSDVPISQGIAMTGAVDQVGNVLAVGGLNEKIEGFFELCAERSLSGAQGVIIPSDNQGDLVLNAEVVAAVERGEFKIWAVGHVDEAVEVAMGRNRDEVGDAVRAGLIRLAELSGPPPPRS